MLEVGSYVTRPHSRAGGVEDNDLPDLGSDDDSSDDEDEEESGSRHQPGAAEAPAGAAAAAGGHTAVKVEVAVRRVLLANEVSYPVKDVKDACRMALAAARRVASARVDAVGQAPRAITALEILLATREVVKLKQRDGEAAATALVNTMDVEELADVALAYLAAWAPSNVIRHASLQMDRCSGTNISQFTFGGIALALAVAALDVWAIETMVSGHTKFAPDFGAHLHTHHNIIYSAYSCKLIHTQRARACTHTHTHNHCVRITKHACVFITKHACVFITEACMRIQRMQAYSSQSMHAYSS